MDNIEWAKKEVELACKREIENAKKNGHPEEDAKYGTMCYESALKAFESLCDDGHSGMSISITKTILDRLISLYPLTPIEDVPEVWGEVCDYNGDGNKVQQCKRMFSLFKNTDKDGNVSYNDVDRVIAYDLSDPKTFYSSGHLTKIVDDLNPITMPYCPVGKIRVCVITFKWHDREFERILSILYPNGTSSDVNRYFKENANGQMIEIDAKEWLKRRDEDDSKQIK